MAEIVMTGQQAIATVTKPSLADYQMTVRELDKMGRATEYAVPIPSSPLFSEWSFFQQVAMLKAGAWEKIPISQIMYAIVYANKLGLDILQGDVYSTGEGRIATSNKAKIKLALATGKISNIQVTFADLDEDGPEGCSSGCDLQCTVSFDCKGMGRITKTQRLSEWFMPKNPNWATRPRHMLELNTLAHACELVNPTDNADEYGGAPEPAPIRAIDADLVPQLERSIAAVEGAK